jgi:prepilin-type N-terminal cleavage/methylation domain-containing protein
MFRLWGDYLERIEKKTPNKITSMKPIRPCHGKPAMLRSSATGRCVHRCPISRIGANHGFTLVELLVVIAIIAVLALTSIQVSRRVMDGARATTALGNLKQLALANMGYASDNGGRIVGMGNGFDWKGESTRGKGLVGRLYPYASGEDKLPSWDDLNRVYVRLRDPNVPPTISNPPTPGSYQMTWASNNYFAEYPGPNTEGRLSAGKRMQQIDAPERVIYLISGYKFANAQMANDSSLVPLPDAPREGIYYSFRGKAPAAFLDGHSEFLSFPIDPILFDPEYSGAP